MNPQENPQPPRTPLVGSDVTPGYAGTAPQAPPAQAGAQPNPYALSNQTPAAQPAPPTQPFRAQIGPEFQQSRPHKSTPNRIKSIASTIGLFVGALLLALVINTFIFQSYEVDGSSMEPTLHNSNRLIIWKFPKSWASLRGKKYTPHRGDIIVFKKPGDEQEQLIKRVIGLPGERVVVSDNKVTVYNSANPKGFNPDKLGNYGAKLEPTAGEVDVKVGAGELFVCGDNRVPGGSLDSRFSLGNVPLEDIVGKLSLRLYPLSQVDTF